VTIETDSVWRGPFVQWEQAEILRRFYAAAIKAAVSPFKTGFTPQDQPIYAREAEVPWRQKTTGRYGNMYNPVTLRHHR
jgi:hypothetical protein